jgi:CHAD domain-containing protein
MAFRFRRGESLQHGVKRMARAELDDAREVWMQARRSLDHRVHEVRTATKKVRALARLVGPAVGSPARRSDRRLGRVARAVSGLRDAQVILASFDQLASDHAGGLSQSLRSARAALAKRLREQTRSFDESHREKEVAEQLRREARRIKRWKASQDGWGLVGAGLRAGYRKARKAMRRALADPNGVTFHAWRRAVKSHRFQLRALKPLWPALLGARIAQLETLGEWLGNEHDLTILEETLVAERACFVEDRDCARILGALEKRRDELRAETRPLGKRLFAERPSAFAARLHEYFRAFQKEPPGIAAAALNGASATP